ncbi:MAG: DUF5455 family protein [Neptuniibacter sp.]
MLKLAEFLQKFFGEFFTRHLESFGSKATFRIGLISLLISVVAATWVAVNAIVATISMAMPSELNAAVSWAIPSVWDDCVVAIVDTMLLKALLNYKAKIIMMWNHTVD